MRKGRVNYRILYFFHGRYLAVLGRPHQRGQGAEGRHRTSGTAKEGARGRHGRAHVLAGGETIAMAKTKDALKILERVTGNGESVKAGIAEARVNLQVAQMIYDARTAAGLSQSQLAALIGSKQSLIARLADPHSPGHSPTMLHR